MALISELQNTIREIKGSGVFEAKNMDVIGMFADDSFPHDKDEAASQGIKRWKPEWGVKNLKISKRGKGWALVNYSTVIAYRDSSGKVYMNTQKYSVSTSTIQNKLKSALDDFEEVDEAGINKVVGS